MGFPKIYITPKDSSYAYHDFPFQFGATELAELKIFLKVAMAGIGTNQHAGNFVSCHIAPDFTDFGFHNTVVSQNEYDGRVVLHPAFENPLLFLDCLNCSRPERSFEQVSSLPAISCQRSACRAQNTHPLLFVIPIRVSLRYGLLSPEVAVGHLPRSNPLTRGGGRDGTPSG